MPESIPDIILRLARQHLDHSAAKRPAAIQVDLPAVAESMPQTLTDPAVDPNPDFVPASDSEKVPGAPHQSDAAIPAVPMSDPPMQAPAAIPETTLSDNSPGTISENAAPELISFEQIPCPSPAPSVSFAEPGVRPDVADWSSAAGASPSPARQFDLTPAPQAPIRRELVPAGSFPDAAATPHDDPAARLEQVTRDMEASLTRLLTTQIEALTRLRERLEEHERRWIEQTGARRAAI